MLEINRNKTDADKSVLVIATHNKGKKDEIRSMLPDFHVISSGDLGIADDIEETGSTYLENALIKARAVCKLTGRTTLADDSGLEVDYLGKRPGVYSARFLPELNYSEKNRHILELLEDVPEPLRTARFVCAMALIIVGHDKSIEEFTANETIEGIIGHEQSGENGFGYDPIFYVPEYKMTTADMPAELKNRLSHRGKALAAVKKRLDEYNALNK